MEKSNADEVAAFIADHKAVRWAVGDRFVLPDIEQVYEVVDVRAFRTGKKFYLYVDLEAECAVEDCEEAFIASKEVHEWMGSPHLPRCCAQHRRAFRTPMKNAWMTSEKREERARSAEKNAARKAALASAKAAQSVEARVGIVEKIVLASMESLSLVSEVSSKRSVLALAMCELPVPAGRDTRKQNATRALKGLLGKGLLREIGSGIALVGGRK